MHACVCLCVLEGSPLVFNVQLIMTLRAFDEKEVGGKVCGDWAFSNSVGWKANWLNFACRYSVQIYQSS